MRHLQLQKYLSLPQKGSVIAEYVWIDGSNGLRSKSKVSAFLFCSLKQSIPNNAAFTRLAGWIGEPNRASHDTRSQRSWCHRTQSEPSYAGLDIVSRRPLLR